MAQHRQAMQESEWASHEWRSAVKQRKKVDRRATTGPAPHCNEQAPGQAMDMRTSTSAKGVAGMEGLEMQVRKVAVMVLMMGVGTCAGASVRAA